MPACDPSSRSCDTDEGAEDEAPCTCRSRSLGAHAHLQHPVPPPRMRHRHRRLLLLPKCLLLLILISGVEGFAPLPGLLHGLRESRAARAMTMDSGGGSSGSRSSAANSSLTSSSSSLLLVKGAGGRDSIRLPARLSACLAVRPRSTVEDAALNSSSAEVGNAGVLQSRRNSSSSSSSSSSRSGSEGQRHHREADDEEDDDERVDVQGEPTQGVVGGVDAVVLGKIIIDEFVLRRQPEGQVMRTGLGGGSPQAAFGARVWCNAVGLVAPAGQDLQQEMLHNLEMYCDVDTTGVSRLRGFVTPRTQIRYEREMLLWTPGQGWDRWDELCLERVPIPRGFEGAKVLHVITEGGGGAEVEMAAEYLARNKGAYLTFEPVMHPVTERAVESLSKFTSLADAVIPDWGDALSISWLPPSPPSLPPLLLSGGKYHPSHQGVYRPVSEGPKGSRGVFAREGGGAFLYHVGETGEGGRWYVGPNVGSTTACAYIDSDARSPNMAKGSWIEFSPDDGGWHNSPCLGVSAQITGGSLNLTTAQGQVLRFEMSPQGLSLTVMGNGLESLTVDRDAATETVTSEDGIVGEILGWVSYDDESRMLETASGCYALPRGSNETTGYVLALRRLCARFGVEWQVGRGRAARRKDWTDVDRTLAVNENGQSVWSAVVQEETGSVYYWNTVTDETSWERPPEMLRSSISQPTIKRSISNIKGTTTSLAEEARETGAYGAEDGIKQGVEHGGVGDGGEMDEPPEIVLTRCARRLNMSHGVLAVRRGSKGSYLLDTSAPLPAKIHWIPCVDVVVSDPTGAGNAYSASFGVNLATLLGEKVAGSTPGGARRREESVVTAGCRASATGAAVVKTEGLPVVSTDLSEWLMSESEKLSTRVTASQAPYLPAETWQDSEDFEVEGGGLKDQKNKTFRVSKRRSKRKRTLDDSVGF